MGADQYFFIYELEITNIFEKPRIDKKKFWEWSETIN